MTDCVFCVKIHDTDDVKLTFVFDIYMFEPLNPVTPGHMLFVSSQHSKDAAADPVETSYVFEAASWYAREQVDDFNLITSAGTNATQTIEHLHVHYVPRRPNDGLHLPWTNQIKSEPIKQSPKDDTTAENPITLEYPFKGSMAKLHWYGHIHDQNGVCRKNRFGRLEDD